MHMLDCLQQLVHLHLHPWFWQIIRPSLDRFIHVHLHNLEDQCQPTRWLIVQYLNKLDDMWMRIEPLQGFNFS